MYTYLRNAHAQGQQKWVWSKNFARTPSSRPPCKISGSVPADLDKRHNSTIDSVSSLTSQVVLYQSSLQSLNESILSALGNQGTKLNATTTALNQLILQISDWQKVIDSINKTSSVSSLEFAALEERFEAKYNMTTTSINVISSQISTFLPMLNATVNTVNSLITQVSQFELTLADVQSKVATVNNTLSTTVTSLTSQISQIQAMLTSVQSNLASLSARYNTSVNLVQTQIASLLSNLTIINTEINTARNGITSLTTRTTTLESNYASLSTSQSTFRSDLNTVQSTLSSLATQLNALSSSVSRLNTSTRTTAYTHCRKDITTCDIVCHPNSPYWYRCTTTYQLVDVSVSLTH